jgi:hypothetical protein
MGDATSSYATAGIPLRASEALKPHHHDEVETPSVGRIINWKGFKRKPPSFNLVLRHFSVVNTRIPETARKFKVIDHDVRFLVPQQKFTNRRRPSLVCGCN